MHERDEAVAAHAAQHRRAAARFSQSRVCSVSSTMPRGRRQRLEARLRRLRDRKRPTCVVLVTAPSRSGASAPRSESDAGRRARLEDERDDLAPVLAERLATRAAGSGGTRASPTTPTDAVDDDLRGEHAGDRLARAPKCAPIAIPASRSAIDQARKSERMS